MEKLPSEKNVAEIFPVEILHRILTFLPTEDLLNVCLVNKKLLSVANSPSLWKELSLNLEKLNEENSFHEFLEIERFQSVQVLRLVTNHSKIVTNHSKVLQVEIRNLPLQFPEAEMITTTFNKIIRLDLTGCRFETAQIQLLFESLCHSRTLKDLNMTKVLMDKVNPNSLDQ